MIAGRPDESTYDESSEELTRPVKLSMAAKAHKSDGDLLKKEKSDNVDIKKSKSVENRELHSVSPPRTPHLFRKMSQRILGRDDSLSSSSDEVQEPSTSPTRPSIIRRASEFFKSHHRRETSEDVHLEEMKTQSDVLSMLEGAGLLDEGDEALSPTRPSLIRRASEFFKHAPREKDEYTSPKPAKKKKDSKEAEAEDVFLSSSPKSSPIFSRKRGDSKGAGDAAESNSPPKASHEFGRKKRGSSAGAKDAVKPEHNKEKTPEFGRKKRSRKSDGAKEAPESSSPPKSSPIFSRKRGDSKGAADAEAHSPVHKFSPTFLRKPRKSAEKAPAQDDRAALLTILQHDDIAVLQEAAKGDKFSRIASEVLYYENIPQQNLIRLIYACGITQEMSDVLLYAGGFVAKAPFDLQPKQCVNYIEKLHTALRYGISGVDVRLTETKIQYGRRHHSLHHHKFKPSEEINERVQAAHYMVAFNLMEGMSVEQILECIRYKRITVGANDIRGEENNKAVLDIISQQLMDCGGILYLLAHAVSFEKSMTTMEFMKTCCTANIQEMMNFANTDLSNWRDLERFADVFNQYIDSSERVLLQKAIDEIESLYEL